jgi:hypothetical protein
VERHASAGVHGLQHAIDEARPDLSEFAGRVGPARWTAGHRRGWTVPWYSSYGSDFNYDFQVTLDESVPQVYCNYRPEPGLLGTEQSTEMPGHSCFLRNGNEIFHTYSTYGRGNEYTPSLYSMLDLTALGQGGRLGGAQGPRPGRAQHVADIHRVVITTPPYLRHRLDRRGGSRSVIPDAALRRPR